MSWSQNWFSKNTESQNTKSEVSSYWQSGSFIPFLEQTSRYWIPRKISLVAVSKNVLPLRPAKLLLDLLFCSSFHHQRVEHILFVQSKFLARCHLVLQHLLKSNPNKAFFPISSRVPLSTYCRKKTRQEESLLQNQSNHYQQSCSLHRQVQKTNYWSKQCGIEISNVH